MATIEQLEAAQIADLKDAAAKRKAATEASKAILDRAQAQSRTHLDAREQAQFDGYRSDIDKLNAEIKAAKERLDQIRAIKAEDEEAMRLASTPDPATRVDLGNHTASFRVRENVRTPEVMDTSIWRDSNGRSAVVERGQRFVDHPAMREEIERNRGRDQMIMGAYGDLGQQVRALTTGGASAVVPTVLAGSVIDLARNKSAVMRAGATVVPMAAKTVQIGRLTTDPTSEFIGTENTAFNASDPAFDYVDLVAKTQDCIVVGSVEWFSDAVNAGAVVENAIAQSMAMYMDKIALYGGQNGTTYGSNGLGDLSNAKFPVGVLKDMATGAATHLLGNTAANGTQLTATTPYNEFLDAIYAIRLDNEEPNAVIMSPTLAKTYAKTYDTTGQPLRQPEDVAALTKFVTNQVPTYDQGTSHSQSDLFVGDWSQLLIGVRADLTLRTLTERYAEQGSIAILATMRWDCALARPKAFAVHTRLGGTA